jgi:dimethylhistidine N-methyltransferase
MGLIGNTVLYRPRSSAAHDAGQERDEMRIEIAAGLSSQQAQISPKYFYNVLGSKLFEAICQLDEYYLTRCERSIFEQFETEIGARVGKGVTLIDLGAGNCEKAAYLFSMLQPRQYVPIDISVAFLDAAVTALQAKHPALAIYPLGQDFSERLSLPVQVQPDRRLFFYPGSSLGNFTPLQALQFLRRLRHACTGTQSGLLIGIDLVKGNEILEAAYDDALGVTAAFNRNILLHANDILQADFKLPDWRHRANFNAEQSRVEMHLEALRDVTVQWPGADRRFAAGDTIHTENSYKYTQARFMDLLAEAGFGNTACWTDAENRFLVCHAEAV